MKAIFALSALLVLVIAVAVSGCTSPQWAALQTAVARASQPPLSDAPATPAFSMLATPTPPPVAAGPMGTLTAIADMFASPTPNREPYQIVNRGKPHFIEFHAWW